MKCPKIVEALDGMLCLTGSKEFLIEEYRKETAANSDILWNPANFLAIGR